MLPCHARALAGTVVLLGSAACTPPEEEFNAFVERYNAAFPPVVVEGCQGDPCTPPAMGEPDGNYLFALSAVLDPAKPVLFDTQLTFNGTQLTLNLTPINAMDRMTLVPPPIDLPPFDVGADGCFVGDFPPITVPGAANGISGAEIVADVAITGRLCGGEVFVCGIVTGNLVMPFMFDLAMSTFTLEQVGAMGMDPTLPKINCNGDLAEPL
jgi:hypothetical protein